MERNLDSEAAIITNDLKSMATRIEILQVNPHYTKALLLVQKAYLGIGDGRAEIHQSEQKRFAVKEV